MLSHINGADITSTRANPVVISALGFGDIIYRVGTCFHETRSVRVCYGTMLIRGDDGNYDQIRVVIKMGGKTLTLAKVFLKQLAHYLHQFLMFA